MGNAVSSNNSYATVSVNDNETSNYLQCVGYGFTIPAGAIINGITVSVERRSSATGTRDAAMLLVKGGVMGAVDRSTATDYPTSDTYEAHGGATDLWGTSWTAADINAANFGAAFASQKPGTAGGARTVRVDHIQISIDYTIPAVINTYYPGTASVTAGSTSITLGAASGAATPIAIGDTVIIMQMQDAAIDSSNSASYGAASAAGAGLYEYAIAASAVPLGGGALTILCGTLNAYANANYIAGSSGQRRFQVIRVPAYANYTLGALTAQAWNGSTGGVLAFDVTGALTLNSATVSVDGMGFRGGAARMLAGGAGANTDYRTSAAISNNSSKGEGIAGTPQYLFTAPSTLTNTGVEGYPNGSHARGAPANGGGGATDLDPAANDQNPGGGGGGNGGAGGVGGIGWCPAFNTAAPTYGCGLAGQVSASNPGGSTGGIGGSAVSGLGAARLTMGGGAGGGTSNNGSGALGNGLNSSGAAGGGIIMVRAGSMTGTATFNANGSNGDSTVANDGAGGGGAGGTVMISAPSGMGGVTTHADGGTGGSTLNPATEVPSGTTSTPHGPGGGGGGGHLITEGAPAASSAAAGANGTTYNGGALFGAYGAMPGSAGMVDSGLAAASIPGTALGAATCTAVNHFLINIGAASASTCMPKSITITAVNVSDNTVTNYTGLVNITTSPAHGDWAKGIPLPGGALTNGAADSGSASYQFVPGDNGAATIELTDHHADGSLTVSVVDSILPSTASTSAAISFSDNAFVIGNDAVQVAGRPQAMNVAMWRKDTSTGVCAISPYYTGAKNLKAWLTRDVDDPGGAAPAIGALSLPGALPGANNLMLTFAAGSANFNLDTGDVGKYALNLRDDSRTFATGADINGSSSTITTRPFALVASAIKQGAASNPANNGAGGAVFAKAGTSFQATLGAYLWNSAADADNDGIADAGAALAQITASGAAPSYRWLTTLSAAIPFSPATPLDAPPGTGTAGSLSNGVQNGACPTGSPDCFTNGIATPPNLAYSEVGSFTLSGAATNFLNSGINLDAQVFDNSSPTPQRNGVVGRFIPDHFALSSSSLVNRADLCPAAGGCPAVYTYFDEQINAVFTITAQTAGGTTTRNYEGVFAKLDPTVFANLNMGAVDRATTPSASFPQPPYLLTPRISVAGMPLVSCGTTPCFQAGVAANITAPFKLTSGAAPEGVYTSVDAGINPADTDGVTVPFDIDTASPANPPPPLVFNRGRVGTTALRYGRMKFGNAYGSELLPLTITATVQYWDWAAGGYYLTAAADSLTSFGTSDVTFSNWQKNLTSGSTGVVTPPASVVFANGVGSFMLSAPGAGKNGSVDMNLGAPAYMPSNISRATFGVYKGNDAFIYFREMY